MLLLLASSYQRRIFNPSRPNPGQKEKINLSFYFHTSLWCLKRFYKGHKGFLEFTGRKGLIVP